VTCASRAAATAARRRRDVKLAVERAILERVPEIREVRAENVTASPSKNPPCPVSVDAGADPARSRSARSLNGGRRNGRLRSLQRLLRKPSPQAPGERCDYCATSLARARTPHRSAGTAHHVQLPPVLSGVRAARRREGRYRPCRRATSGAERLRARRPPGTGCRSRSGSAFFFTTPSRAGRSRSIPDRRVRPNRSSTSKPGPRSSPSIRELGDARSRTSKRCWCCAATARHAASSCRSTPRTSWSASSARRGKASTAVAKRGADRSVLRRDHASAAGRVTARGSDERPELRVVGARAEPYAAAPQLVLRLRVTKRPACARSTRSRCAPRFALSRSAPVRCR
jgi:hypothetical protein